MEVLTVQVQKYMFTYHREGQIGFILIGPNMKKLLYIGVISEFL